MCPLDILRLQMHRFTFSCSKMHMPLLLFENFKTAVLVMGKHHSENAVR